MKKSSTLFLASFLFILTVTSRAFSQTGLWTWMHGSASQNYFGNWGTQGVSSPTNQPPSLYESAHWTDDDGNFWIFGGYNSGVNDRYSALWKYDPITNEWIWMKGPAFSSQPGEYGILGIPSADNNPGARGFGMLYWKDHNGDFWMYGGDGFDEAGALGSLSDLWKYEITTNEWTWMGGNNSAYMQNPSWGTFQTFAATNLPGPRVECTSSWVDKDGNLWFFGGNNVGYFNAVWAYDVGINQWAWMNGANTTGQGVNFGTQGVFDANNHPDGRYSYCTWVDKDGKFWYFGGGQSNFSYADVWQFDPDIKQWCWIAGSTVVNSAGNYNSTCDTSAAYLPRARLENTARWLDECGNVWMYGGMDYNFQANRLSDLWVFSPSLKTWSWVSGPSSFNQAPVHGTLGYPDPTNTPGSRFGPAAWKDADGNFWLYGGWGANSGIYADLWKYTPDPTCPASLACNISYQSIAASDTSICEKFCINFFDSNTNNPIAWEWLFPGGTPSSSSDQNPSNICYDIPGTYDVTLITTTATGTDTITLIDYIDVFATPTFPTISQNGNVLTSSPANSYQWQFNSVDIPGATNQSFTATQTGFYTVVIGDTNGCKNSGTLYVDVTGIEESEVEFNAIISPNPSAGNLGVELTGNSSGLQEIMLFNSLGQRIYSQEINGLRKKEIQINHLANGIYVLEIHTEELIARKKIIIMK